MKLSEEVMNKRRLLYAELREKYLMEVWEGEENEISGTLDFYEESVIHYGLFDIGWTFLIDELENYGAYDLIEEIRKIVEYDKYSWHDGTYNDDEEEDI
jgi:hypothetical protein